MEISINDITEDCRAYYSLDYGERILDELIFNAYRTIKSVYLFKNLDDYVSQLKSDKNEDKNEQYWNAVYYEKLMDYVKISIAFENFNKALLIEKGYLVHKIQKKVETKDFYKRQNEGKPIKIDEFKTVCSFKQDKIKGKYYLEGIQNGFPTISYSDTLNPNYQEIIQLDNDLLIWLKEINQKRNKLHFFTDFKGGIEVKSHIMKWRFIMSKSIEIIESKYKIK